MSIVPRVTPFRQRTIGTGQGQLPGRDEDDAATGAAFQLATIPRGAFSRQDSLGESLGRHDDMQQLSDEDAKKTEAGFKEVQQYLAAQRAEKQRKEKKKKKGKTKSKKVNGGRKRRRRTRRKTRRKSGGEPHGEFEKGGEVQLTEAGLDYYTTLTDRARWLFGGRPQPDRETAATWRGRIKRFSGFWLG